MILSTQTLLQDYYFLGNGQSVVMHGIFLNEYGEQINNAFTYTVGTTTPVDFATMAGGSIPSTASYAIICLETNKTVHFACSSDKLSDFTANPSRYPYLSHEANPISLGRGAVTI